MNTIKTWLRANTLLAFALAALVGIGTGAGIAQAGTGKAIALLASGARTSTSQGSAVSVLSGSSRPITGTAGDTPDYLAVQLTSTVASGTLDLTIEGSMDGTNYATLTPSAAWTQVTTTGVQHRYYLGVPKFVRAKYTIGGASPTHTFKVDAWGIY